tara:strand:- start:14 stop:253 length:240 start_codon:yes stop_codon:yes gene_type:complete
MKRNLVISTKVTPEEKAEFTMIAKRYGISLSEWVYSTLSMNKNGYEKVGKKRMDDNESIMSPKILYKKERIKFSGRPKE